MRIFITILLILIPSVVLAHQSYLKKIEQLTHSNEKYIEKIEQLTQRNQDYIEKTDHLKLHNLEALQEIQPLTQRNLNLERLLQQLTRRNIQLENRLEIIYYGVVSTVITLILLLLFLVISGRRRSSSRQKNTMGSARLTLANQQAIAYSPHVTQDMQSDEALFDEQQDKPVAEPMAEPAIPEAEVIIAEAIDDAMADENITEDAPADDEMLAEIVKDDVTDDALIDETMLDEKMDMALHNQPSPVAQHAFPESLQYLRALKTSGTSEHDLWQWVQDMLLHMPKYGLKNDNTMMLPETEEEYSSEHWLEQGLRHFNDNHFSDALRAFFQVHLHAKKKEHRISADFMKLQILFRLELWQDADFVAVQMIEDYAKSKKSPLLSISMATAYMVRTGYAMWLVENEKDARKHIDKALLHASKLDVHDLLMAGVIIHAYLFKIAFFARNNPALSLNTMKSISTIFADTVIPEIQIVRDGIKDFF